MFELAGEGAAWIKDCMLRDKTNKVPCVSERQRMGYEEGERSQERLDDEDVEKPYSTR